LCCVFFVGGLVHRKICVFLYMCGKGGGGGCFMVRENGGGGGGGGSWRISA